MKKVNKIGFVENMKRKNNLSKRLVDRVKKSDVRNISLFSFIGVATSACNVSEDDQCFAGLGVVIGSICANDNDAVVNSEVKLVKFPSKEDFALTVGLDAEGDKIFDRVEFTNENTVTGTKYTLTEGDIIKNPGNVILNLINTGSIDGQKVFNADSIELSTQGTTVILTSNWYNNDFIQIKDSDQSVTLNDLQASKLDAAVAEDNLYYPGTIYKIEDVYAPADVISFYFNGEAILGTSTEVDLEIKDSIVGVQAGVFIDPNAEPAVVDEDPFLVAADTNIEKLNLHIADTASSGSRIVDLVYEGLESVVLSGGTAGYNFEISDPLEASLIEIDAINVPTNLILDVSESTFTKTIFLGSGNDIINVGNSLVVSPDRDTIDGGDGADKILIKFEEAATIAPILTSFETLDLFFNGESNLDFSMISDIGSIDIYGSSSPVSLSNVPFDLTSFNISGSQTGAWSLAFEDNGDSSANLNWSNNTGSVVTLTSLAFDEVKFVSFVSNGASNVILEALSVDEDDTTFTNITNIADGDLRISSGANIDTLDALTALSLTATEGGNISVGSVGSNFGITDAPKLSTINLVASETGGIELGAIGTATMIEDLQSVSIATSGADINLGSIQAKNSDTFSVSMSSSSTVTIGSLTLVNSGASFVASGSGNLAPIVFANETYALIDLRDLVTDANLSLANAQSGTTILLGSGNNSIALGLGPDTVTGNSGVDIFTINDGSSGLSVAMADTINEFQSNIDKLNLGLVGDGTSGTGNYVESSAGVSDYSEALTAANSALTTLNGSSTASELYAFQYDSNFGYLFVDTDSNGAADDLILLTGIESSSISSSDIIA